MRMLIGICSSNLKKAALVKEQCRLDMRKYSFLFFGWHSFKILVNACTHEYNMHTGGQVDAPAVPL